MARTTNSHPSHVLLILATKLVEKSAEVVGDVGHRAFTLSVAHYAEPGDGVGGIPMGKLDQARSCVFNASSRGPRSRSNDMEAPPNSPTSHSIPANPPMRKHVLAQVDLR